MSNRILGILIILGFIGSGIIFYMYFFVYYIGNINIISNIGNYKVELYNKKLLKTNDYACNKKICNLNKISPFSYSLTISKSGYIDFIKDIEIGRNQILNLDIILDKKIFLSEKILNKIVLNNLTVKEKINILRNKKTSYYYINLNDVGNFSFKEEGNFIILYKSQTRLGNFNKIKKSDIKITNILGTNSYIFIKLGKNKYIYSIKYKKRYLIDLNIDINYLKIGQNNREFVINTIKGAFIYDKFNQKSEYFDFFRDFVYYKSGYIGIIDKNNNRRLNNLGLQNITKNLIIYYNTDSKEKKILYKTPLDILKIYKIGENIMFISSEGKEYKLDNF